MRILTHPFKINDFFSGIIIYEYGKFDKPLAILYEDEANLLLDSLKNSLDLAANSETKGK